MTSAHLLIVPRLPLLSETVGLQTPPHNVLTSCTRLGEYLPLPLAHVLHLVGTSRECENQIVRGINLPSQVPSVSLYQVPVVLPVSNVGHQTHTRVLAWRML